jgi:hypothetical protein
MNENSGTYLRIFEDDGSWITRPAYMLLAAMSEPDLALVEQVYSAILWADEFNPPDSGENLSKYGEMVNSRMLKQSVRARVIAGEVVLELARLASATGKPPTVTAARKLVALNRERHKSKATPPTIMRDVEKSLTMYRNTAHFQAVAVLDPDLFAKIEDSEEATLRFLGLARAFEEFMDANVMSAKFKWAPVRVPQQIQAIYDINLVPLLKQELRAAGVI